ncbi:hypothetical protein CVT26_015036 [Gymnopilus dilepis]|uniref:Lysine-specific metallo-endopeptidase domain-containing protein n=1 Tax=Gymnopilus dilepis TaxID=231916 RepID=A0A409W3Z5_9AGAR|nr:hypothetical protein CVT26_015036 [Gymnopilus dilepis]
MRATFVTFLTFTLWAATLKGVVSMPLGAIIGDGSPENKAKITESLEIANKQIKNMDAVNNGPNSQAHPAVIKAFGKNANVDAIRANVGRLATEKIKIPHTDPVNGVTQGATRIMPPGQKAEVSFGHVFYGSNAHVRAGTIIHEAAHAIHGAVDHFDANGNPHPQGSVFDKATAKVGYKDSHLDELKEKHSENMHHNADSYRVFGEECPEARELFERALEENDLEIRSHLVRRAGKACAYRPRGKGQAHTSKAAKTEARFARKSAKKAAKAARIAKKAAKAAAPVHHAKPITKKAGARRPAHRKQ